MARLTLAAACALALAAAGCGSSTPRPTPPVEFRGSALTPPVSTPDFALRDQDGKTVRLTALGDRYRIITFLYTHCPDVCPLIAANLNQALRELTPAERRRVRVLAISVDPKHDTPAAVDRFVADHRLLPQFRYLTGSRRQLERVWRSYGTAVPSGGKVIPHTSWEILGTPDGRGIVLYDSKVQAAAVAHDLRLLLKSDDA